MKNKLFQQDKKEFKSSNSKSLDSKVSRKSINSVKDININKSENNGITEKENRIKDSIKIKTASKQVETNTNISKQTNDNKKSEFPANSPLVKETVNIASIAETENSINNSTKTKSEEKQTESNVKTPIENPNITKPEKPISSMKTADVPTENKSYVTETKKETGISNRKHNEGISANNSVTKENTSGYSSYPKASISNKYKKTNLVKIQSKTLKDRLKNKKITIAKVRLIKPKPEFSNKTYPAKTRLAKKFAFKNEINSLTQKNKKKKSSKSNALKTNLKINENETSESGAEAIKLAGQTYDYAVTGVKIGKRVALSPIRVPSKIIAKVKSINRAKRIKLAKKTVKAEIKSIKSEIKNIKNNSKTLKNSTLKFKLSKLSKPIKVKIVNNPQRVANIRNNTKKLLKSKTEIGKKITLDSFTSIKHGNTETAKRVSKIFKVKHFEKSAIVKVANPQRLANIRNNAKELFKSKSEIGKKFTLGSFTSTKHGKTDTAKKVGEIFKLKRFENPIIVKIANPQKLASIRNNAKKLFKPSVKLAKKIALISLKTAVKAPISVVGIVKNKKLKSNSKPIENFKLKKLDKSFKIKKTIVKKQRPKKNNAEKVKSLKKRLKAKKKILKSLNSAKGREGRLIVVGHATKPMSTAFAQVGQQFMCQRIDVNNTGDTGMQAVKLMGQTVDYARTGVTTTLKAIKSPIKLTKNTIKTVKTLRQAPKNIKNAYRSVKKSAKIINKTSKTAYKATKEAIKLSYRVGQFAAKIALKIAIQAAQIASKAITAMVSNPYVLAVVAAAVLVFILIVTVSNAAGAVTASASGALESTIGWLLGSDTTEDGIRLEYANNETTSINQWDNYVEDIMENYHVDEIYINSDFFTDMEKLDYFCTLYTKKLKDNPGLTIDDIKLSETEIYDYFSEYLEYTEVTSAYYINGERVTYAVITFDLNNDLMDDLGFTDEDKQHVDDIKTILGDILV